ncbi:uncharacterized protein L203_104795 [Cryptococcus depauperatus CBS 7841]|uniref:Uncharacterized protein n=1 Tax=Cryptococcus depauperatus CBS 7841 TaxID=1295531 RepID=A0AAJ8JW58_9TREE
MNSQWSDYLGSNPLGYSNIDGGNGNDPYSLRSLQGQSARGTNQPGGTPAYNLSYTQLNPNGSATGVPPNDCMSWDPSTDQGQLTEETGGDVAPQYSPMSGNPEILVDTRHLNPQNPRLPPQFKPFAGSIYNVNAASLNPPGLGPPILFGPLDEQEARNILFPGEISSNAPSEAFSSHPNDTASVMSGLSGRDANTPPLFAQTIGRRHSHSDVGRLPSNIQSQGGEAPSDSIFLGQTVATLTLANKRFRSQLSKCWKEKNRWERGHKSVCDRKKHLEEESIKLEETKLSQGGQVDQRTRDEMEGYLKQTKSSIPSQTKWIVLQRVEKEGIRKELLWTILIQANRRPNVETQIPRSTSILALSFEKEKRDRLKTSKSCEPNETQNRLRRGSSSTSISDRAHGKRPRYDVSTEEGMISMEGSEDEYKAKKLRFQEKRMEIECERRQEEKDGRRIQLIRLLAGDLMIWRASSDNMSYPEAWAKVMNQVEAMQRGLERHAYT